MPKVKIIKDEDFRRMQLLELEMLVELDRVCKENNIKYQIWAGTLLGAVRHKGYIPWDDDADVVMLREEYEKFKRCADQLNPEICFYQDHDTDSEYRWGYAKLRKTGTKYVRFGQEHVHCQTGVFIDVFPLDDVPKSTIGQMLQDFHCFCLRKIMWSEIGKYSEKGLLKIWYSILSKIPIDLAFKQLDIYARKSKNSTPNKVRTLTYTAIGKLYRKHPLKDRYGMPKRWFLNTKTFEFEGKKLVGLKDYDECLKFEYGDYMKLPPKEKRVQHAPVSDYEF